MRILILPAQKGARHIVLLGSSSVVRPDTQLAVDSLMSDFPDLSVSVTSVDLSDAKAVHDLINSQTPAVRGVFHLATTYVAGLADSITSEALSSGFDVKAKGALNLDTATRNLDLDFFFAASSLAGLFGNHYQAVYASANTGVFLVSSLEIDLLTMFFVFF